MWTVERLGFIQDMLDVKVLILYVAGRLRNPVTVQELYELAYQDDRLSYFDVCTAVPELVKSGHLQQVGQDLYMITDKGRSNGAVTEDSIAYPVRERAKQAVDRFNKEQRRSRFVKTKIVPGAGGEVTVKMQLDDEKGRLMRLELMAPNQPQAVKISRIFKKNAELIYNLIMADLLDEEENLDE